ncbi:MAG: pilus assembly protein PilM [Clostridium sp.]|nr:pilus assembly protein PilM [Clostridium sp.]
MAKVLSMEVGYSLIKIIETDFRAKSPRIYRCVNLQTPDGILNDGELTVTDDLVALINDALMANKMKTKQVVFTVASSKIASREVILPNVKENKVATVVRANASDYFPVDISRYEIAYTQLGVIGDTKETMQRKVMVFAAPQALLEGYQTLAQRCGLTLAAMDYSGNSILQVIKKECEEGIQMVIKVDERSTIITIMEEGQLVLQRSIPYGVDEAVDALIKTRAYGDLDYKQTLELLIRKTCVNRTLRAKVDIADAEENEGELDEGEQFALARQQTTAALEPLISGIARVVDFYHSRNYGKQIDKTYLTGLGGDFSGLSKLLTNELGTRVVVLTKAEGFNLAKAFRETGFGGYIACLGAAVAPLGFMPSKDAEKKEKGGIALTPLLAVSVLILCLIISIAWFVVAYLPYRQAASDNAVYRSEVQLLAQQYVPDYMEYTATKQAYEYMFAAFGQTQLETQYVVEFIEEMERKMPHAFYISTLHVNATGFSMNATVATKEEAAACIEQLRTFASIAALSVNGIYDGRQVLVVDVDGDGVLEMVSGGEVIGHPGLSYVQDEIDTVTQGVTFSVDGVFSGLGVLNTLTGGDNEQDGNADGADNAGGIRDAVGAGNTDSGADSTADSTDNAEDANAGADSDAELESAISEINGGE